MYNMEKPHGVSFEKEQPASKSPQKGKTVGILVALGLLILGLLLVVLFSVFVGFDNKKTEEAPNYGDSATAQAKCEEFVKEALGNPVVADFNDGRVHQDTRLLTHYQVIGNLTVGDTVEETRTKSYKCDLNYFPESDEWTSDTQVAKD